jgi:DNA-binding MarR family transcriptional regulator
MQSTFDDQLEASMGREMGVLPSDLLRIAAVISDAAVGMGCSTSDVVSMVERGLKHGDVASLSRRPGAATVKEWKRVRMRRNSVMETTIFRDPAWDMLLDLYSAEQEGKRLTVSQLCYGSGVAIATALRHIDRMVQANLLERRENVSDHRSTIVSLTPAAKAKFERFLDMAG